MTVLRVFIDSNTIVSGLVFHGPEADLIELGILGAVEIVATAFVLEEVRKALGKKEFDLSQEGIGDLLGYAQLAVLLVEDPEEAAVRRRETALNDKKDAPVWAGYEASGAKYLLTGDRELLEKVKGAIRSRALLDELLEREG